VRFADDLLEFVLADLVTHRAPMKMAAICLPSKFELEAGAGREDLDREIEACGGYENVARRLGRPCLLLR
jgi:hypothetical protein